jgi:DMSO/TMAO reductase YedYZ molybdopterin-dependent catalytic subunit
VGTAVWTGTPLRDLLEEAGLQSQAIELLFTGLDKGLQGGEMQHYQRSLSLDDATREEVRKPLLHMHSAHALTHHTRALMHDTTRCDDDVLQVILAYEMNGQPLLPQHGAPLRLIVPGWYGMTNVKWLDSIEAVAKPFDGYQMQAYMFTKYPGTS